MNFPFVLKVQYLKYLSFLKFIATTICERRMRGLEKKLRRGSDWLKTTNRNVTDRVICGVKSGKLSRQTQRRQLFPRFIRTGIESVQHERPSTTLSCFRMPSVVLSTCKEPVGYPLMIVIIPGGSRFIKIHVRQFELKIFIY